MRVLSMDGDVKVVDFVLFFDFFCKLHIWVYSVTTALIVYMCFILSIIHLKPNTNSHANLNFNILKLIKLFDIDTKFRSRATGSPVPFNVVVW